MSASWIEREPPIWHSGLSPLFCPLTAEEVVQRLCRLAELGRCQIIGYDARRSGRRAASRYGRSSAVAAGLDESHSERIEAMKDNGGELSIKSQLSDDGQLLISVTDTGVGLPSERADEIFYAFSTTKPHGTGLGLAITRSIVESHGGRACGYLELWTRHNVSLYAARYKGCHCMTSPERHTYAER